MLQQRANGVKAPKNNNHLTVDELQCAEEAIVRHVQKFAFLKKIVVLQSQSEAAEKGDRRVQNRIDKGSTLNSLDPQLRNGLLTVGGRLRNASIPENAKHQLILPKNSPVSVLLIKHVHQKAGHQCRNHVLAELKRKYWIIKAGVAVRSLVNRCVVCRKYQAKASKQKMADLPAYRLQADNPPFTHTGVDYFGQNMNE